MGIRAEQNQKLRQTCFSIYSQAPNPYSHLAPVPKHYGQLSGDAFLLIAYEIAALRGFLLATPKQATNIVA